MPPEPRTILDLERRRVEAMLEADVERLEALLAPDLVWVHASAREDDKASLLAGLGSGDLVAHALTLSDQIVRIYGDAALCRGTAALDATMGGQRRKATHRYSTLWIGQAGTFRLAFYQSTGTAR